MTDQNAPAGTSPGSGTAAAVGDAQSSLALAWLRGALILAGAAQLITISALTGADRPAATWSLLLLAIAPAPLAAATLLAPVRVRRPAAIICAVVLVAGIAGAIGHTGLFFVPALAVLVIGAVKA